MPLVVNCERVQKSGVKYEQAGKTTNLGRHRTYIHARNKEELEQAND